MEETLRTILIVLILAGTALAGEMDGHYLSAKNEDYVSVTDNRRGFEMPEENEKLAPWEMPLIDAVVEYENLTYEQSALLYAIRKHEFGGPGIECGVELPLAKIFKDRQLSCLFQLRHAARIIKQRYNGDVSAFGVRYHNSQAKTRRERDEAHKHWAAMVKKYMRDYRKWYPKGGLK